MSLDLAAVSVRLHGRRLFAPISLSIAPGQVATVMGASGAGKSTLLDAIGGHLAHGLSAEGRVTLDGQDLFPLPAERRRVGLMFQDALLFPHLSVGDNLAFGLAAQVKGREARAAAVQAALDQAGLSGLGDRDPATLSGGQRARAALMRTLLAQPLALLLDEPFSKLDRTLKAEIRAFTFRHIQRQKIPALMVSHDPDDADAANGMTLTLGKPG